MSVKVSSAVWHHSRAKGTARLVLLAIADHCQDDGSGAYPSIEALARKCQLSTRAVQDNIRALQEIDELSVEFQAGPRGTNRYIVHLEGGADLAPPRISRRVQEMQGADTRRESAGGGADTRAKGVHHLHPNLEQNHQERKEPKDADPSFDAFWTAYPRHRDNLKPGGGASKHKSRLKWQKLTEPERAECLIAVEHYRRDCEREDGPFAAHVTTWLNERRWEDWLEPAGVPGRASPYRRASEVYGE